MKTQTQTTVKIRGSEFQIEKLAKGDWHEFKESGGIKVRYAYRLVGKRSTWKLLRNQHDPELLFGINEKTLAVSKWWLRESRGILAEVQVGRL